ncbi:uncharacterized protein PAC_07720 [Phialocephala subalpina]|uniref:Heterokaryon incompatibility domain-containing protein n=1 Tax=Phialocephala subalpina TaxID=576137 RepID=A0A1L7WYI7_9HELO|nr:uncharacterized protein PAC_07720 [Phialocephala subalpina]
MGAFYGNSLLTILAAGASDCTQGCFIRRKPARLLPASLPCWLAGREDVTKALVYFEETSSQREPLDRRAWALQEGLLAPRTLSYGTKEMWWECNAAVESDGGRQILESMSVRGLPKPIRSIMSGQFPQHNFDELMSTQRKWLYILSQYGNRNITFLEDRLPALSGIAEIFSYERQGDKYNAGLWESDMPTNLLWNTLYPADQYRTTVPSWSWASLGRLQSNNVLRFDEQDVAGHQLSLPTATCSLISASVTLKGSNRFGEVTSGVLILKGPLKRVWLRKEQMHSEKIHLDRKITLEPDVSLEAWILFVTADKGLLLEKVESADTGNIFRRFGVYHSAYTRWDCAQTIISII